MDLSALAEDDDVIWAAVRARSPGDLHLQGKAVVLENVSLVRQSSVASDVSSSAGDVEPEPEVVLLHWFMIGGVKHVCRPDGESSVPLCRTRAYKAEHEAAGADLSTAFAIVAPWCSACVKRLAPEMVEHLFAAGQLSGSQASYMEKRVEKLLC